MKILIFERNVLLREGLADFLSFKEYIALPYGINEDHKELYIRFRPEVVIIGIDFDDYSNLQIIEDIIAIDNNANIIAMSVGNEYYLLHELPKIGTKAFLFKGDLNTHLIPAIDHIHSNNESFFSLSTVNH